MKLIWIQCRPLFLSICLLYFVLVSSQKQNIITTSNFLSDKETILSSNGTFEMGFFSTANSSSRYLGIWYYQKDDNGILEVVWVANRDNPVNDSSGVLQISKDGKNIQIINGNNETIWSSNVNSTTNSTTSIAQLQDIGNLVLLENDSGSGNVIWQSFDHPANTLLQHMDVIINDRNMLRSWKSYSDPSSGDYTVGVSIYNLVTEAIILKNDYPYWRSGPWNGNVFIGIPRMRSIFLGGFNVVHQNSNGKFSLTFSSSNQTNFTHYVLTSDGVLDQKDWDSRNRKWEHIWSSLDSNCDIYGYCGQFGICNPSKSPFCSCLKGFEPTNKGEWRNGNWTSGCSRRTPLQCGTASGKADGFLKLSHMKAPANVTSLYPDDEDCRSRCFEDCTCLAYSFVVGIGCMMWNRNLIDIQDFSVDGVDLFIRLADAELGKNKTLQKVILPILIVMGTISLVVVFILWRLITRRNAKKNARKSETMHQRNMANTNMSPAELNDMPLYTFEKLVTATNNFQETNKLGRGGFGPVYKGKLENGQEVAVKRLSNTSGQGLEEFMNEVMVISKLQHMNLVRLLGCCVEGDEKMLVYEYMPNKSLNAIIFDPVKKGSLDWKRRFNIIEGICRGLLYLHRDSRLRIIHRDLKASNILLDKDLNPKISDFGMARIFGHNEDQGNTLRVVGTYGYMSPEYAMSGKFSEKSDVFSFGVLLLEIISGRSINSFRDDECLGLLGYAWKLWNEDSIHQLIDATISDPLCQADILKCMQLALLCVQEYPEERPSVSSIMYMLHCDIANLPHPKQPGFTQMRSGSVNEFHHSSQQYHSLNHISITDITPR